MERQEFMRIIAVLKSNYTNFGVVTDEQYEFWYRTFKDEKYQVVMAAVQKLISTSISTPTIAHIKREMVDILNPKLPDASDAWGEVTRAIRYYGIYRETEALESLSDGVRGIVKAMGYKSLCMSENQMADRAHFMKMYEQGTVRTQKELMLSDGLKGQIAALAESFGKVEIKSIEPPKEVIPDSYEDDCGADDESEEERFKREYKDEYGEDFEE